MQTLFIYLFGVLRRFQHCTGNITTGSWKGRGNQYIQFVRVLYCKLPTNRKQLPAFQLEAVPGTEPRPLRWEARVLPLCHCGPQMQTLIFWNRLCLIILLISTWICSFWWFITCVYTDLYITDLRRKRHMRSFQRKSKLQDFVKNRKPIVASVDKFWQL